MDTGLAFETSGFWRPSALSQGLIDELIPPGVEIGQSDPFYQNLLRPSLHNTWIDAAGLDVTSTPSAIAQVSGDIGLQRQIADIENDSLNEVWQLDCALDEPSWIESQSWETFERQTEPLAATLKHTRPLSEAGDEVFDAAIELHVRDSHPNRDIGNVIDYKFLLDGLRNVSLGRASTVFRWSEAAQEFSFGLSNTRITGLSQSASDSIIRKVLDFGRRLRQLTNATSEHALATTLATTHPCLTRISLFRCISSILDEIHHSLHRSLSGISTFLQLQNALTRPSMLLDEIESWINNVRGKITNDETLQVCQDIYHRMLLQGDLLSNIFTSIVNKIVSPWIDDIIQSIHESTIRIAASTDYPDDAAASAVLSLQSTSMLNEEQRALYQNLAECLVALHQQSCSDETWDAQTREVTKKLSLSTIPESTVSFAEACDLGRIYELSDLDSSVPAFESSHNDDAEVDHRRLAQHFISNTGNEQEVDLSDLAHTYARDPFKHLTFRMKTHAWRIEQCLLRLLFTTRQLRLHFQLQNDFHLFSNHGFVSRLSFVLFSDDTQISQRRGGQIPTSEQIGLRLNLTSDRSWPPATSEVRLALAGILADTREYRRDSVSSTTPDQVCNEVINSLSFSIRELSDDEIDRVLDGHSIYALDFLRLSYTPPAPLQIIFAPRTMQRYDSIFRLLLRFLRVRHVLDTFHIALLNDEMRESNPEIFSFSHNATYTINTTFTHFMNVGIRQPWTEFMLVLDQAEASIHNPTSDSDADRVEDGHGIAWLRESHDRSLKRIQTNLFLGRHQAELYTALEGLFTAILHVTHAKQHEECTVALTEYWTTVKTFLSGLDREVRRSSAATFKTSASGRGVDAVDSLLLLHSQLLA